MIASRSGQSPGRGRPRRRGGDSRRRRRRRRRPWGDATTGLREGTVRKAAQRGRTRTNRTESGIRANLTPAGAVVFVVCCCCCSGGGFASLWHCRRCFWCWCSFLCFRTAQKYTFLPRPASNQSTHASVGVRGKNVSSLINIMGGSFRSNHDSRFLIGTKCVAFRLMTLYRGQHGIRNIVICRWVVGGIIVFYRHGLKKTSEEEQMWILRTRNLRNSPFIF